MPLLLALAQLRVHGHSCKVNVKSYGSRAEVNVEVDQHRAQVLVGCISMIDLSQVAKNGCHHHAPGQNEQFV